MPKIPNYAPQESTQAPEMSRISPAAGIELGRAVSGLGNAVSAFGQKLDQHDTLVQTSQFNANAELISLYNKQQWEKVKQNADPNDPDYHNLAKKFMAEVVQPNIEALDQNLTTDVARAHYQVSAAKMLNEMGTIVLSDQAALTGEAVKQNAITVANSLSTGVFTDPSSFDSSIDRVHDHRMVLQRGGMPVAAADKWESDTKAQLAQSAVRGMAQLNPDKAQAILDSGRFDKYLDGNQKGDLNDYIARQKRTLLETQRADATEQRRKDKEDADKVAIDIQKTTVDPNTGAVRVPPTYFKDITNKYANMPGASPEAQRAMTDYGRSILNEQENGEHVVSDPHTYEDFGKRAFLPATDPRHLTSTEVYQARIAKKLSTKDSTMYLQAIDDFAKDPQKQIAEKRYQEFLTAMKPSIGKVDMFGNFLNGVQAQAWLAFQHDTREQFEQAYAQGKWQELLDQRGSSYMGNQMPRYTMTIKGAAPLIKDIIKGGPPVYVPPPKPGLTIEPRKAGETWDQYKARTGWK